ELSPADQDRLRELNAELASLETTFQRNLLADTKARALPWTGMDGRGRPSRAAVRPGPCGPRAAREGITVGHLSTNPGVAHERALNQA
ncbi:MAG TPA: hypothetical protein VH372_07075, partial [Actinospica sp.]|nr:hypothetical protein [Actinospica sp.]